MKRQVLIASALVLCSLAIGGVDGMAQTITNQFRQPTLVVGRPYRDIDACPISRTNKILLAPGSFMLPPTNVLDLDDGYQYLPFPSSFRFNFNNAERFGIYVSINGFATFEGTKLVPAKQPNGLFINSASYPENVIAPFWGDHRLRTAGDINAGFMPAEISWVYDVDRDENCDTITPVRRCIVIQWKNLNINDQTVNSSVGNFQARLYETTADNNFQGDIEFAYGQIAGNPFTTNTTVVTRGATVGIKGNGGFPGFLADFWNGLVWIPNVGASTRTDSTTRWQPSGGRSDAVIRFSGIVRFTFDTWGFGDADTSAARGARHENLPQNRRVTSGDARVILRSIVTNRPLDSVWKRQAYQGDVNHSGRFYYTTLNPDFTCCSTNVGLNPVPPNIVIWRRTIDVDQFTSKQVLRVYYEGDGLYGTGGRAPDVSNLTQIYYEVTEYDAALIMRYLSGRLPMLPWIKDNDTTGPDFGKTTGPISADNVAFGTPVKLGNGLARVPVYLNNPHEGVFAVKFASNSEIINVNPVSAVNGNVDIDNSKAIAVVTGNGSFDVSTPVAYVTVKEQDTYIFSGIRFNDVNKSNQTIQNIEMKAGENIVAYPNPMTSNASITVNVPVGGVYTVRVYDAFGKLVNTVFNGQVSNGMFNVEWNGRDASGATVSAGAYMVRVDGNTFSTTTMMTVVR